MQTRTRSTGSTPQENKPAAEDVRKKAYELFEKRGREPGHELEDWFNAEKLVMSAKVYTAPPRRP